MSLTDAVQVAVVQAMQQDGALSSLVGARVYDRVPANAAHPYVSLGPEDWPQVWADCLDGIAGTIQIDVWSREPGRREAKALADHVARIFAGADLALSPPYRAVSCEVLLRRVLSDPDGITTHGVVQIRVEAEAG